MLNQSIGLVSNTATFFTNRSYDKTSFEFVTLCHFRNILNSSEGDLNSLVFLASYTLLSLILASSILVAGFANFVGFQEQHLGHAIDAIDRIGVTV